MASMMQNDSSLGTDSNDGSNNSNNREQELRRPLLEVTSDLASSDSRQPANRNDDKDIVFPSWMVFGRQGVRMNHNVFLSILLMTLYGLSESLWAETVTVAYIKKLGRGRNTPLGAIEAVGGMAELFSAVPVGNMADRIGKSKVIAWGGWLLLGTGILHILTITWIGIDEIQAPQHRGTFWILGFLYGCWGIAGGVVEGPTEAIYADSVPEGKRAKYYVYLYNCYNLASCLGPVIAIILFQSVGDKWDFFHLRLILYVGLGMEIFNAAIMMLFDEEKVLEESDSDSSDDESTSGTDQEQQLVVVEPEPIDPAVEEARIRRQQWIPHILFTQDLIWSIGEGMSIEFYPLFFKDEMGMSPTQVQIIYFILPVVMTIITTCGEKVASQGFGRAQTTLVLHVIGLAALYAFIFLRFFIPGINPVLLTFFYIIKITFMEASSPLEESIMMDFAPRRRRAFWMSLDSVSTFGWCGTSFIGGILSDRYGYMKIFLFTAILQTITVIMQVSLIFLVPRKEGRQGRRRPRPRQTNNHNNQAPDPSTLSSQNSSSSASQVCDHHCSSGDEDSNEVVTSKMEKGGGETELETEGDSSDESTELHIQSHR